jgi:hypothetical protein
VGADAIPFKDAEPTGDQADYSQVSFHELSADIVDVAQSVT